MSDEMTDEEVLRAMARHVGESAERLALVLELMHATARALPDQLEEAVRANEDS